MYICIHVALSRECPDEGEQRRGRSSAMPRGKPNPPLSSSDDDEDDTTPLFELGRCDEIASWDALARDGA